MRRAALVLAAVAGGITILAFGYVQIAMAGAPSDPLVIGLILAITVLGVAGGVVAQRRAKTGALLLLAAALLSLAMFLWWQGPLFLIAAGLAFFAGRRTGPPGEGTGGRPEAG
jgi:hypothetical protein